MTDQPPAPRFPKLPAPIAPSRVAPQEAGAEPPAPAPVKKSKKKVKPPTPEELEVDTLLMSIDERACLTILTTYEDGMERACATLGWTQEQVGELIHSPRGMEFLRIAQREFMVQLAKSRVRPFAKAKITQSGIEQRLWHLANIDPSETKGSMDGQVKALKTLGEMIGGDSKSLDGKTREELQEIVSRGHAVIEGMKSTNAVQ